MLKSIKKSNGNKMGKERKEYYKNYKYATYWIERMREIREKSI